MHPFLRLGLEDVSVVIGLWGKSIGMYMVVDGYECAGSSSLRLGVEAWEKVDIGLWWVICAEV